MSTEQKSPWSSHPFFIIIFIFVCLYSFTRFGGPLILVSDSQKNLFTVEGTGTVKATPTNTSFSLSITAKELTEKSTSESLNVRVKKLIDDMKYLGIKEVNIKTSNLQSYPEYTSSPVPLNERGAGESAAGSSAIFPVPPVGTIGDRIAQWTASETLEIKADSVEIATKAIEIAQHDGVDPSVNGVQFTLDDASQKQLEQKARIAAIKDAKMKAQELAQESGLQLGRLINVTENSDPIDQPNLAMKSVVVQSTSPQLAPGKNTVTKTVTLSYETR